jgi:cell pole-organizing protein PopZ
MQDDDEADVLELTEMVPTKPAAPAAPRRVEPSDVVFRDPEPPMREPAPHYSPPPIATRPDEQLLSQHASSAVSAAFSSLGPTPMFTAGDSRTIEELVREMLRPMLKSWLDDNLPGLVERLVRAEIERVSRGR